jgi:hypothetical protein
MGVAIAIVGFLQGINQGRIHSEIKCTKIDATKVALIEYKLTKTNKDLYGRYILAKRSIEKEEDAYPPYYADSHV